MALLTEDQVLAAARVARVRLAKSADTILREARKTPEDHFDIFLSHNIKNADIVLGTVQTLRGLGKSVYVDWLDDPSEDRENVTPETAEMLRTRMKQSDSLLYLHSRESKDSRWMAWELGYFDGLKGMVAILPVVSASSSYKGQEYLGLYPYVDIANIKETGERALWINRNATTFRTFDEWPSSISRLRPAL